MQVIQCADETEARAIADDVDAKMGYPLAGTDIGEGVHVPPEQSITRRYAEVRQTKAGGWEYPVDAASAKKLSKADAARAVVVADAVTPAAKP